MRPEKQFLLDEIKEKINQSQGLILVRYEKFPPIRSWDFSSVLAQEKSFFEVVKKRIFMKAAEEAGIKLDLGNLGPGHIGVVFLGGDTIETTKKLFSFKKGYEELSIEVISAYLEKKPYTANDVEVLSQLPGQKQMQAEFLGLLEAPMSQTLAVMQSLLCSTLYCLENKSQEETKK